MAGVIWGKGCVKWSSGDQELWWWIIPGAEWYQKMDGFQSIGTHYRVRWLLCTPWMTNDLLWPIWRIHGVSLQRSLPSHLQSVVQSDTQACRNNNPVKDLHSLSSISLPCTIFHFISLSPVAKRSLSMVLDKGALNTLYCYFKWHHN